MVAPMLPVSCYGYRPGVVAPPAVSIITPFYNTGGLFLETVHSVLGQSLQQWEWIVVNDGSDDPQALRVLLPLRHADGRIRVLDQENRGPAAARNAGVAASRAPLLFFLDSDDVLVPTALEQLAWALVAHPESAFVTSWSVAFGREHLGWRLGFATRHAFLYQNMAIVSAMVRREVFVQVGGFDESLRQGFEDYEFWLRCAAAGFWGHDVRRFLIWVRRKRPDEYGVYRWSLIDDPDGLPVFRRAMRSRYPQLYRDGLPRVGGGGGLIDAHVLVGDGLPFANRLRCAEGQRRVLLLLPWIRVGGVDTFALDVVRRLMGRGVLVSVCLLRDETDPVWFDELQRASSDVFDLSAFLVPADYPRFLQYVIESRQITTVLISNALLAYQLLIYVRSRCPQVTVIDYLHMEEPRWRGGGLPRAAIEHEGLIDLHVVSSEYLRLWMVGRGAEPGRVAVCTTNVDVALWVPDAGVRAQVRAEFGIGVDCPVILFAGRLVPQKRPRFMVEVLRALRRSGGVFVALVAGDGEDAGLLRRFVWWHGLSGCVRFLGAVPHERLRALMAASDVLLLPSEYEGIALTLYEALASGVVPVAADVGGQRELVTPDCGVLIARGGDEQGAYVAALRLLIADPARRARMAAAGRERVVRFFTAEQLIDRMVGLFALAEGLAHDVPRAPVSRGVGMAAATLAIEHFHLERRLRALPPVRVLLAVRRSSVWRVFDRFGGGRSVREVVDRAIYEVRREVMRWVRRFYRVGGV